jgi:CRP-like cAMP-binding protein
MHPLFNKINYKVYSNLYSIKEYKKGSLIFSEGEICDAIGLIIKGEIQISTLTNNDKEYIISTLHKDDIFGENLLFSDNNQYLGDCISTIDSKILYINKSNLFILLENKQILENYLKIISEKNTLLRQNLKLFSQKSIEDRIMFYLISEQKKLNSNIITIKSKESLARILNIPRPSLSRELIKLKEKGIIDFDRYNIIMKKTA